jgi:hypothetical protein
MDVPWKACFELFFTDSIRAATPATCGVAMLVPDIAA